jgi:hypothetical protein
MAWAQDNGMGEDTRRACPVDGQGEDGQGEDGRGEDGQGEDGRSEHYLWMEGHASPDTARSRRRSPFTPIVAGKTPCAGFAMFLLLVCSIPRLGGGKEGPRKLRDGQA